MPTTDSNEELRSKLNKLIEKSPINEDVPDDIWESIYATWTGLWTDGYGKWDERQPSDIYPLDELLSVQAKDRFVNELLQLILSDREAAVREELNYLKKSFQDNKDYKGYMVKQVIDARKDGQE